MAKTIGVLGGMGPRAGVELLRHLVDLADCGTDQAHPDILLVSRPASISDRTEFLRGRSNENPGLAIGHAASELVGGGAEVLVMACHTAHAAPILAEVERVLLAGQSRARFLNIVDATIEEVRRLDYGAGVGILATEGTYACRVYENGFAAVGVPTLRPSSGSMAALHEAIYEVPWGIKACSAPVSQRARVVVDRAIMELQAQGAKVILLACTELPLAVPEGVRASALMLDPMRVLARDALIAAGVPVKHGGQGP